MDYASFFQRATGSNYRPYPWQARFSRWSGKTIAIVSAPTGAGKESGAVIPWLYAHAIDKPTTTRLVYALPTRSLVDQVHENTRNVVAALGLSIQVYCLKGGKLEHGFEQDLTQPAILIGTQDQLLSRALNRGFGVSWGQRPLHYAALTNDCRWILDEIQLTGVAYKTLVQIFKHWRNLCTFGNVELCLMSATFDDRPLEGLETERFELDETDFANSALNAKVTRSKPVYRASVEDVMDVAALVRVKHFSGSLTLAVTNTVARARELGKLLSDLNPLVIHSRFLGIDREKLQEKLKNFKGIVIATQVVEAGVDLDADLLITELCPWSSFVQRCGRCGRKRTNNLVAIYWLDYQRNWQAKPYEEPECLDTRGRLLELTDASLHHLSQIPLPDLRLPSYLLTKRDVETFFNTHPKRRDANYTVSQYVRDPDAFTVSVVWSIDRPKRLPHQKYTCPVPTKELIKFCQSQSITPLVWGEDDWEERQPAIGEVVWLPLVTGGYSHQRGWTANPDDKPQPYRLEEEPEYNDPRFPHAVLLGTHLNDTERCLRSMIPHLQRLNLPDSLIEELCRCARWHDWGKAHQVWQTYANAEGELLAKSTRYGNPQQMQGYRHELASAFAAAAQGASFLSQYLIAAHHGKVRDGLEPLNEEKPDKPNVIRGVALGTELPHIDITGIETLPPIKLALPFTGKIGRWNDQVKQLLREYGPFKLVYLEALIRNADIKASQYRQEEAQNDSNNR